MRWCATQLPLDGQRTHSCSYWGNWWRPAQLNSDLGLALLGLDKSPHPRSNALPRLAHIQWVVGKGGQSPGPLLQLGIPLKSHSGSRTPWRNDWSVLVTSYLPDSASFRISLYPRTDPDRSFLIKDKKIFQSLLPVENDLQKSMPNWNLFHSSVSFLKWHCYLPQHPHPTTWGPLNFSFLLNPMPNQYPNHNCSLLKFLKLTYFLSIPYHLQLSSFLPL